MHLQSKGQTPGATKMVQLVQALAPKPDDLSLILRSHVVAKADSSDLNKSHRYACMHTYTCTQIFCECHLGRHYTPMHMSRHSGSR